VDFGHLERLLGLWEQ